MLFDLIKVCFYWKSWSEMSEFWNYQSELNSNTRESSMKFSLWIGCYLSYDFVSGCSGSEMLVELIKSYHRLKSSYVVLFILYLMTFVDQSRTKES